MDRELAENLGEESSKMMRSTREGEDTEIGRKGFDQHGRKQAGRTKKGNQKKKME